MSKIILPLMLFLCHISWCQSGASLYMNEHIACINDVVHIPVQVNGFENVTGASFTLLWNNSEVDLLSIEQFDLPNAQNSFSIGEDNVNVLWLSLGEDVSLVDGDTLLILKMEVLVPSTDTIKVSIADTNDSNPQTLDPYFIQAGFVTQTPEIINAQIQPPSVTITALDELDCVTDSIVLNATTNLKSPIFHWESLNAVDSSVWVKNGGFYEVAVTSTENNCKMEDVIEVIADTIRPRGVIFEVEQPICDADATGNVFIKETLGGHLPITYKFIQEDFSQYKNYHGVEQGLHSLIVRDNKGCEYDTIIHVEEVLVLDAKIMGAKSIDLGATSELKATINTAVDEILWIENDSIICEGCDEIEIAPLSSSTYKLIVTDSDGCIADDLLNLQVEHEESIFLPSAFSPNNDGFNDFYTVGVGKDVAEILRFEIYDRWGNMMYEQKNNEAINWDGYSQNTLIAPSGEYVCQTKIKFINGVISHQTQSITLIR